MSENLCLNKQAVATPTARNGFPVSNCVDGLFETYCEILDYGTPANITIDLGDVFEIAKICVVRASGRIYHSTKEEISEDGVNWVVVFDSAISGEYEEEVEGRTHVLLSPYRARYVRSWSDGSTANVSNHWREIKAFTRVKSKTYQETILATDGLLGYYPLYVDGKDLSALGSDMSNAGSGTPIFTTETLSPEGFGSFHSSKYDSGDANNKPSFLSLPTPTQLQCLEAYVKFDIEPSTYCGLMGFNLTSTSPDDNAYRVMLSYDPSYEKLRLRVGLDTHESDYQASLFSSPKHVVMQYELEQDATIVYVDGAEVARVNGGEFNTLITNSKLLAGAFTYTSPSTSEVGFYGNSQVSDFAVYNRPLTQHEIDARVNFVPQAPIVNLLLSLSSITWSNRETKAQANPQPIYLEHHGISPFDSTYAVKNNPFYADPIVDQNSKLREFGYIESKTELSDVPVANKRVMLFSHDSGVFIDETVSDANGNYRFDSLLMSKKYMVTAQYGNADEHTPPDYNATSSDWQTPTKYGEE